MNRHLTTRQDPAVMSVVASPNVRPGTTNPDTPLDRDGHNVQRQLTTSGRPKTSVVRARTAGGGEWSILSNILG